MLLDRCSAYSLYWSDFLLYQCLISCCRIHVFISTVTHTWSLSPSSVLSFVSLSSGGVGKITTLAVFLPPQPPTPRPQLPHLFHILSLNVSHAQTPVFCSESVTGAEFKRTTPLNFDPHPAPSCCSLLVLENQKCKWSNNKTLFFFPLFYFLKANFKILQPDFKQEPKGMDMVAAGW